MSLTNNFRKFLHNVLLALALWYVADKQAAVWYGRVHLQLFAWSDLITIQLQMQTENILNGNKYFTSPTRK